MAGFLSWVRTADTVACERIDPEFWSLWRSAKRGGTLLHYVAAHGTCPETMVPFLIGKGLDPNAADANGNTALTRCFGRVEADTLAWVSALIEHGADPDQTVGKAGYGPLSLAIRHHRWEVYERLLAAGMNRRPDRPAFWADEWAVRTGQKKVLDRVVGPLDALLLEDRLRLFELALGLAPPGFPMAEHLWTDRFLVEARPAPRPQGSWLHVACASAPLEDLDRWVHRSVAWGIDPNEPAAEGPLAGSTARDVLARRSSEGLKAYDAGLAYALNDVMSQRTPSVQASSASCRL